MANIICSGFGGQGVLTMGLILAKVGMDNGKNVIWIPSYGSEMRGGTANCNVKISDEEISSPFVKRIDVLIAMNQPSIDRFERMVVRGGTIVSNKSIVINHVFRKDINVIEVNATEIADHVENPRGANIVMIGALAASNLLFEKNIMVEGIDNFFLSKGKNNPKNRICFEKGYEAAVTYMINA
jgi:2-oxoglutarate ferredoxin oxidoreductase subunit gamma